MRLMPLFACTLLVACGPTRDESFKKLTQFTAVNRIAANATSVYFVEDGALKRVANTGGVSAVVLGTQTNDFALADKYVFAASVAGVQRLGDGPQAGATVISSDVALAIAADANGVSWADCSHLTHASLDGQTTISTLLSPSSCSVNGSRLTLDATTVYGVDKTGLWFASRSGGPITRYSSLLCTSLALGTGWVYCGNADGVWRVMPGTGRTEQLLKGNARDVSTASDHLFVAMETDLVRVGQSSGATLVLGTYADITAVSAANGLVYFVNTEAGLGLLLSTAQ